MKLITCRAPSLFILALVVLFSGCGGGDDSSSPDVSPCSVLKIAGGEGCTPPNSSIAVVATNKGYCSGTFITRRHVLTAAHCIPGPGQRILIASRNFSADATRAVIHPLYNGAVDSPFDIAVVTIGTDAPTTPVPLKLSESVERGDTVTVYGFGLDEDRDDLIKRRDKGGAALKATFLTVAYVDPGTIGSFSDGGDTCPGDSGGALLFDGANGQPGIVAIVRAGPDICVRDSGLSSQNSNVQAQAVVDFILRAAPGTGVN